MGRRPAPCGTETRHTRHGCRCDACVKAHLAWYAEHGAAARERAAAWRKANPEKRRAQAAVHRDRHRDKRNADALERYHRLMAEDPERVRALRREWAGTEKGRMAGRLAAHVRRGAAPTAGAVEYAAIILADPCSYCGEPAVEIDHIDPVASGGDGDWPNLAPACRRCNARKNDRRLLQFVAA